MNGFCRPFQIRQQLNKLAPEWNRLLCFLLHIVYLQARLFLDTLGNNFCFDSHFIFYFAQNQDPARYIFVHAHAFSVIYKKTAQILLILSIDFFFHTFIRLPLITFCFDLLLQFGEILLYFSCFHSLFYIFSVFPPYSSFL